MAAVEGPDPEANAFWMAVPNRTKARVRLPNMRVINGYEGNVSRARDLISKNDAVPVQHRPQQRTGGQVR